MATRKGTQTWIFDKPAAALGWSAVGSKLEGEGPLGEQFDYIDSDGYFGESSWEKAESQMQKQTVTKAIEKAGLKTAQLQVIFAGDLLNQCISSIYGLRDFGIPFLGIYGACSTMAEGLLLSGLFVESGIAENVCAVTSSHFCSAERQFRFPLEYGSQRPPTAQWTATASGAVVVGSASDKPQLRGVTIGNIKDMGVTDANNMGAAMAPAAAETIKQFLRDSGMSPQQFDLIVTGDLGQVGSDLLLDMLQKDGLDITPLHNDCGLMLYDRNRQQVDAGGSGCGCSASVLCSDLLPRLQRGELKNLLFIATGALMSTTAVQQGESIPGIAHLVWLSSPSNN